MNQRKTRGICKYCGSDYTRGWMRRHIQECGKIKEEHNSGSKHNQEIFLVEIKAKYVSQYWLFVGISGDTSLETLDIFLRSIWLECCGHLSRFKINNTSYGSEFTYDVCDYGMDAVIQEVLHEGLRFTHEYDFGTPTVLELQVIAKVTGQLAKEKILLYARNEPPKISCDVCGDRIAAVLCFNCIAEYVYPTFLCETCETKHKDESGHDDTGPIANSPRMGVCGYIGSDD